MRVIGMAECFGRGRPAYAMHEAASERGWSFPGHTPAGFCEVLYVLAGEVENRVAGAPRLLHAGDLCLIRERDRHAISGRRLRYGNVNVPLATWRALAAFLGEATVGRLD